MSFIFTRLDLPEIIKIEPQVIYDDRGFFMETFKKSEFVQFGIKSPFVQDNQSKSKKGEVRAIHYQIAPKAQGKLIKVLQGKAIDIAVDLRKSSQNFKKWISLELSAENNTMLYIPPGFGHGFLALTDDLILIYKCTNEYSKEYERGVRFDDPEIGINWGMESLIVSEKDKRLPLLKDAELFV